MEYEYEKAEIQRSEETEIQRRIRYLVTNGLGYTGKLNEDDTTGYNLRVHGKREVMRMTGCKANFEDRPVDLKGHLGQMDAITAKTEEEMEIIFEKLSSLDWFE